MKDERRQKTLVLRPIGWVQNRIAPSREEVPWEETTSELVFDEALAEALDGIEDFSHIVVIFWLDWFEAMPKPLKVHPMRREDLPLVGVLATRSPVRPNPLGMTVVELLGRRGPTLEVRGLDAYNGTPILDMKPYIPGRDAVPGAKIPSWLERA